MFRRGFLKGYKIGAVLTSSIFVLYLIEKVA